MYFFLGGCTVAVNKIIINMEPNPLISWNKFK